MLRLEWRLSCAHMYLVWDNSITLRERQEMYLVSMKRSYWVDRSTLAQPLFHTIILHAIY